MLATSPSGSTYSARDAGPHIAPQCRHAAAAQSAMAGLQLAEHRTGGDPLAGPHRRQDGLIAGPQPARMGDRHQRPTCQLTREDHGARRRGVHRLTGCPGEVDTPMSAVPVWRRGVEYSHNIRTRPQRPLQPLTVGRGGCRQDDRGHRQGDPSHTPSSPLRRRTAPGPGADLWITRSVWKKHPRTACKLLSAARLSGLTSRVCATTRFNKVVSGCRRSRSELSGRVRQPAVTRARRHPTLRVNRQQRGHGHYGCCNHETAAGQRHPLRASDPSLESQDEAVHLHRPQRHLHHRSAADADLHR